MDPYEAKLQKDTAGNTGEGQEGNSAAAASAASAEGANGAGGNQNSDNIIPIHKQQDAMKRIDLPAEGQQANSSQQQSNTFNEEAFFTEKSAGKFKSWADIQAELSKGPQIIKEKEPLTFANESSKQFYELVSAGEIDKALPILQKRSFAAKVKDLTPDELLIAHLQEESGLTEAQAKRQLERTYSFDETGLSDEDKQIETQILNTRKKKDAEKAQQYFISSAQDLKLPSVTQQQAAPPMSDSSKAVMKFGHEHSMADVSKFPFEFAPANSTIKVQGQTSLPTEKVQKLAEEIGKDPEAFIAGFMMNRWFDKDKKPDAMAIARDVAFYEEAGTMMNTAVADAVNQFLGARLAQEKNIQQNGGGAIRMGADLDTAGQDPLEKFFHIPAERKIG